MHQLNYHHLYYFFVIAREGSIVKAAKILNLTPQTVSGQLGSFEAYLGKLLFDRKGRRLVLNEAGKHVFSYAEDIFALGTELQSSLRNQNIEQQYSLSIGIVDVIPKTFVYDLLKSCLEMDEPIRLICRQSDMDTLLAELALNKLDLVVSDRTLTPGTPIKAYSHPLGECGLTFYAHKKIAKRLKKNFPQSLDQQEFLICGDNSMQKISLFAWFESQGIAPKIVAEFDDSALLKIFGKDGYGVFCTPTIIEQHVEKQYEVSVIGRTEDITERFYAISPERKFTHPGIIKVAEIAKTMF
jgi:LysR family transcriptional activator of nhaA